MGQAPARPAFQIEITGATAAEVAPGRDRAPRHLRRGALHHLRPLRERRARADRRGSTTVVGSLHRRAVLEPRPRRPVVAHGRHADACIDLRGIGFDPDTSDVLAPGSVNGLDYEVRAWIPVATPADLGVTPVDTGAAAHRYRVLPGRSAAEHRPGRDRGHRRVPRQARRSTSSSPTSAAASPSMPRARRAMPPAGSTSSCAPNAPGPPSSSRPVFTVMACSLGYPAPSFVQVVADDNGTARPSIKLRHLGELPRLGRGGLRGPGPSWDHPSPSAANVAPAREPIPSRARDRHARRWR